MNFIVFALALILSISTAHTAEKPAQINKTKVIQIQCIRGKKSISVKAAYIPEQIKGDEPITLPAVIEYFKDKTLSKKTTLKLSLNLSLNDKKSEFFDGKSWNESDKVRLSASSDSDRKIFVKNKKRSYFSGRERDCSKVKQE